MRVDKVSMWATIASIHSVTDEVWTVTDSVSAITVDVWDTK